MNDTITIDGVVYSEVFKTIDGSIYSIDGKELVRAKISANGFVVPEGTEVIAMT